MVLIGIDFGNQKSSAAIYRNNATEYLTIDGKTTFPTALTFLDNNILLGKISDDITSDCVIVTDLLKLLLDKTITIKLKHKTKIFHSQEIIAMFLSKIKSHCESFFKVNVDSAIITVSASLSTIERNSIMDAALLTGINIAFASINDVYVKMDGEDKNTVAIHFGTYLTEVLIHSAVQKHNYFIPIGGNTFDIAISNNLKISLHDAEKIKKILTQNILIHNHGTSMTKVKFEDICSNTFKLLTAFFDTLDLKTINPDKIIVSGNTFKIPKLKELFKEFNVQYIDIPAIHLNESYSVSTTSTKIQNNLGVGIAGDVTYPIIKKNSILPANNTITFTTYNDNQSEILMDIFLGSRIFNKDNQLLTRFLINNIPPAPRGHEIIELTFCVDINYVLKITSKIISTGKTNLITLSIPETELKSEIHQYDSDIKELMLLEKKQKLESLIGYIKNITGNSELDTFNPTPTDTLETLKTKINNCAEIWKSLKLTS